MLAAGLAALVLILVLMEDTLRAAQFSGVVDGFCTVLILVLMEDTLRDEQFFSYRLHLQSLNPCFNGRYSQREPQWRKVKIPGCLNPCFNGRYSQRIR